MSRRALPLGRHSNLSETTFDRPWEPAACVVLRLLCLWVPVARPVFTRVPVTTREYSGLARSRCPFLPTLPFPTRGMDEFHKVGVHAAPLTPRVHAVPPRPQATLACISRRSLRPLVKAAAAHPRAYFNDPDIREQLFGSGILAAALGVLGVTHGLKPITPDFALPSEDAEVRCAGIPVVLLRV